MIFPFRKGKKMSEQQVTPNDTENTDNQPESAPTTTATYEELQERIAELEAAVHESQLRVLATEQNLHRRFSEELKKTQKFAAADFANQMLTVKDYLEMALQDNSGNIDTLKMGVSMTLNELQKAFDNTGIKEILPKIGEKTNPHHHQEMQAVESEQEAGTIVAILKKGYTMNERVLRPAMVTVAKAPETTEETTIENHQAE